MDLLDDGVEVQLRSGELVPLVTRAERIGDCRIAGMLVAACVRGTGELTAAERDRLKAWQNTLAVLASSRRWAGLPCFLPLVASS
ncbi:hypothetical protein [Arthrobacter sp. HLT1-20]